MMPTRSTTLMIEKVPRVDASFLETTWSLGLAKNRITYLSLLQRHNTLPPAIVVCNLTGLNV